MHSRPFVISSFIKCSDSSVVLCMSATAKYWMSFVAILLESKHMDLRFVLLFLKYVMCL